METVTQLLISLYACVSNHTHLTRTSMRPLVLMEFIPEFLNLLGMCHVNKSLPVVGLTLFVNGHVEEVVAAEEPLVNLVEQDVLRESIRDVPDHQRVLVGVRLVLGLQSFDVACVSGLLQFAAVQVEG